MTIEQKIEMFLDGHLSREESDQLWIEMMEEPAYYDYFKTAVNLKHIGTASNKKHLSVDTPEEPEEGSSSKRFYRVAIAATIVMIIGILGYLNLATPGRVAPPVALHQLAMQTTRSTVTMNGSMESDIQRGIDLANQGKTTEAIALFQRILNENPDPQVQALALSNLGIMYYNLGQMDQAITAFNRILKEQGLDILTYERAYWYAGNAYLKEGKLKEARGAISKAYSLDGAYRRVAGQYLKKLNAVLGQ